MRFSFEHNALPGSLELAYLGDTLWDLYVRSHLVQGGGKAGALHRRAVALVCAHAQSGALSRIEPLLTGEEADVVRRARNAHQNPPKNADAAEYHRATALEALVGFLYVTDRTERLQVLMETALPPETICAAAEQIGGK